MIKEITFHGYSSSPSDYECPDGSLSASLNLICEDAQIKGIPAPQASLSMLPGENLLLIHDTPTQKNYLLSRPTGDGGFSLCWMPKGASNTDSASLIASFSGLRDIAAIGNVIALALDSGLGFILWKDNAYKPLGSRPPFVSIDFGLYKAGSLLDSGKYDIPVSCIPSSDGQPGSGQSSTHAITGTPKADLAEVTQMAYGLLNSAIAEKVSTKGNFCQPFFIRYAYRLYDGSYCWHSAPILMLPSIIPPKIKYSDNGSVSDGKKPAILSLGIPYFSLAYRIVSDVADTLSDWADIVTGIDIFASAPIYTYDQSKDLEAPAIVPEQRILRRFTHAEAQTHVFMGHYAEGINATYQDVVYPLGENGSQDLVVNIQPHEHFTNNILSVHDFYKIAELDFKDIAAMDAMAKLELKDKNLTSIVTRPTLPDDYQSHCRLFPSSLYPFNARLNLAGLSIAPAEPFPIRSVMQFGNPEGSDAQCAYIKVWTRANGVRCFASRTCSPSAIEDAWRSVASNFPRFIYYSDASAYKMEIALASGQQYILDLKPHDFLNGAYFFDEKYGLDVTSVPPNASAETADCPPAVSICSKIYTSEVNNPFRFPALGINTVGSGSVYAICSAAKALSQGQFGQFPLYAFTSEGVWALETSQTGTYVARQPISRDVILPGSSPLQMDGSVMFATDRGIMIVSGSQTQCITDKINGDGLPSHLPGVGKLFAALGLDADTASPSASLSAFLADCGMLFDYAHQRVVVFNPAYPYAYVYSIKSGEWGMMLSNISAAVKSYPEALAISDDNKLLDFSSAGAPTKGLLITRPLKLDMPDVLKTIDAAIARGNFSNGHAKSVLYGSRDLVNWHLVWSSADHRLRGLRGTPYKYFRLVLQTSLAPGESLCGTSIQFSPRLTDQPR